MNIARAVRRLLLLTGFVVVALGFMSSFEFLGIDVLSNLVLGGVVAIVAIVMGLWGLRSRYRADLEAAEIPDVELPLATDAPGDDIDRMIHRLVTLRQGTLEYRNQIRERLGEAATAVIINREDCTRSEAIEMLRNGTWTDNAYAQAFFDESKSFPSRSLGERFQNRDEKPYERRVRETVAAISELAEVGATERFELEETDDEDEGGVLDLVRSVMGADDATPSAYRAARFEPDDFRTDAGELVAEGVRYRRLVQTGNWKGITGFALVAAGFGLFFFSQGAMLAAVVPVALAAYAQLGSPPPLAGLDVERHFSEENPEPGDEVEVTVTVENAGDSLVPDVRLVDRVPPTVRVVEGAPRVGTALRAGETVTFKYTLLAERGDHNWPLMAVGRDLPGSNERVATIDVEGELECSPRLATVADVQVRQQTSILAGQVNTRSGGPGLEFHSLREYRHGDPTRRIDWKRYAAGGELTTIDFRQEQAATVVLLFDARRSAYVSPRPGMQHALDRSVDAATEIFTALADNGDLVGLAAFDTVPCWLGPSAGDDHMERARQLLSTHPALSSVPPDLLDIEEHYIDPMTHVRRQLPPAAQVMIFSPLGDDYTAEVARRLNGAGHLVTVFSPDPTANRTVGQRLAKIERAMRVNRLREREIRVLDWATDESIGLQMERAAQRW